MAANSANAPGRRNLGRPWQKGQSGNPRGRSKVDFEIRALCREHTEEAVKALVLALKQPRYRVAAAMGLLAYGYGRPPAANDVELPGDDDDRTITIKVVHVEPSVDGMNGSHRVIPIPPPANDDD